MRADRRDGVAGHARRRRAHVRRRGHPDRGADGELAGPHRAAARHVDGEGAARVPARRASCAGCCPRRCTAFTDTTITAAMALDAELAATRARGYGTCAGELESALYGVSAPVLDRTGRPLAVLQHLGAEGPGARAAVRRAGPDRRRGRPGGGLRAGGAAGGGVGHRRHRPPRAAPAAAGPGRGCGPAARAARPGRRPGRRSPSRRRTSRPRGPRTSTTTAGRARPARGSRRPSYPRPWSTTLGRGAGAAIPPPWDPTLVGRPEGRRPIRSVS